MTIHEKSKSRGFMALLRAFLDRLKRPYDCPFPTLDTHDCCNREELDRLVRSHESFDESSS
jgi:hypothetical protein